MRYTNRCRRGKAVVAFHPARVNPRKRPTYYLSRLVRLAKACELVFTGEAVTASEAKEIGLVNEVVPAGQLVEFTYKMAKAIARGAPLAMRMAKQGIYQGLKTSVEEAVEFEKQALMKLVLSEDHQEAVKAYLEKRAPVFKGK